MQALDYYLFFIVTVQPKFKVFIVYSSLQNCMVFFVYKYISQHMVLSRNLVNMDYFYDEFIIIVLTQGA